MKPHDVRGRSDETANTLTHAVGLGMSIVGIGILVSLSFMNGTIWHQIGTILYGTTLIVNFLSSTLYHSTVDPILKRKFRILDHVSIYLAIAGTYTPFLLIHMRSPAGFVLLSSLWVLCIIGVIYKLKWFGHSEIISVCSYLIMGWLGLLALDHMIYCVPEAALIWILAGGVFYTIGVYYYWNDHKPYYHTIWHIFVILGAICHYISILFYLVL